MNLISRDKLIFKQLHLCCFQTQMSNYFDLVDNWGSIAPLESGNYLALYPNSVTIGTYPTPYQSNIAIGNSADPPRPKPCQVERINRSVVIGPMSTRESGYDNIVFGDVLVSGDNNIAIGNDLSISGKDNIIISNNKTITDDGLIVIGDLSIKKARLTELYLGKKFKHKLPAVLIKIIADYCADLDSLYDLFSIIDIIIEDKINKIY